MGKKDDYAIVLDYLPYGYPLEHKKSPMVQAIGEDHLGLLELAPIRGASFEVQEKVYIGPEKRDKVYYIIGKTPADKMTEQAKIQLQHFIARFVGEHESRFVEFFNKASAINTRLHVLELIPGFGRKHTDALLSARDENLFSSFEDIKQRVPSAPDPKKAIEKRLWEEIMENPRQRLFVT